MTILVTGGTGTVGSRVVASLVLRGEETRVLTRSAENAAALPGGVTAAIGSLSEPSTLGAAFEGVARVFLLTPLAQAEAAQGLAGIEAAKAAGVERIVFMSVHKAAEASHIPHFGSKVEISQKLEDSGIPHTVLEPNSFYQNDVWVEQALTGFGLYPHPLGSTGLNRVDVRDIADAAVSALLEDGHEGEHYPIVGPDAWTGESTARAWGEALGREITYAGDDLDAWAQAAQAMLPEWLVNDLRIMYEEFQARGLLASDEDYARQRRVLGRDPRGFEAFAAEMAAAWTG
jgi:uncharacterized protein YbjT (DUF2867 family)